MAKTNQGITLEGNPLTVKGEALSEGSVVPDFVLTANDLSDLQISAFAGKAVVICAVPSLDTPVCDIETKRFNKEATDLGDDVAVLVVSRDLPFAQQRWCGAEGIERVVCASDHKHRTFGEAFGVELPDAGLLARAVFVVDKEGKITYADYMPDLTEEPNYDEVLAAVRATQ